jgi:dTDP-4-amino-4,6-dideoxygalactose transaminase
MHGFLAIARKDAEADIEKEIKKYFGTDHVVLVSSGKAALYLILSGLHDIRGRRKVIIPAYTCFTVPSAIRLAGLDIVLCDIEPETMDFDFTRLKDLIDDDTLCVVSTHLFGIPADVSRVRDLCRREDLFVVEDAAQAMGADRKGKKLGTLGDVGFFSLGRGKNITCGSGGVIVTSSSEIAASIRKRYLKTETVPVTGQVKNILEIIFMMIFIRPSLFWFPKQLPFLKLGETRFERTFPVRRFTGFQAGLLCGWRSKLETMNRARSNHADDYIEGLGLTGEMPIYVKGHVYNRFPVYTMDRSAKDALCESGNWVGITPMYPSPVHRIPELEGYFDRLEFEGADEISDTVVTLPTHILLNKSDTTLIRERVRDVCRRRDGNEHDSSKGIGCH